MLKYLDFFIFLVVLDYSLFKNTKRNIYLFLFKYFLILGYRLDCRVKNSSHNIRKKKSKNKFTSKLNLDEFYFILTFSCQIFHKCEMFQNPYSRNKKKTFYALSSHQALFQKLVSQQNPHDVTRSVVFYINRESPRNPHKEKLHQGFYE